MQLRTFDQKPNPFKKLTELLAETDSQAIPVSVKELTLEQDQKEASEAFLNAKEAAKNMGPTVILSGVDMMRHPGQDFAAPIVMSLGFFVAISGIILDPLKAPFAAVIATEEALHGSYIKIKSLITDGMHPDPEQNFIKKIYLSFIDKMNTTANLLIHSGLEKKEDLSNKIKSHDIQELIGLSILYSAYHSRTYPGILLSNEYVLTRSNCPPVYQALFDKFMVLKDLINSALDISFPLRNPNKADSIRDAEKASQWIQYIKSGKLLVAEDNNQFTEHEISLINHIILQIAELKQSAKQVMPESEEKVTNRISI